MFNAPAKSQRPLTDAIDIIIILFVKDNLGKLK
jgi:hypothetical protein